MSRQTATPGAAGLDVFGCELDGISLIEASAGTGKTWNICGLYLRLLLERRLEVQQILVVTFTNAATAELRERVRTRIVEALEFLRNRPSAEDDFPENLLKSVLAKTGRAKEDLKNLLEAALGCFDEAAIFTIHGFCQRALADTPLAAGLPYAMELLEDDAELRHEGVADFWRREVAGAQTEPLLAAYLASRKDSPEKWAQFLKRVQAKPLAKLVWPEAPGAIPGAALQTAFDEARDAWASHGDAATEAILEGVGKSLNGRSYTRESVEAAAKEWDPWLKSGDPLSKAIGAKSRTRLFRADALSKGTNKNKTTPHHPFFETAEKLLALREQVLVQLELLRLGLLRDLVEKAGPELRQKKRARRGVAYDDMLYNAHEALTDGKRPWLAAALRSRYPAALIDEFQDTDPLQCAIFMKIHGEPDREGRRGPLFLVGDPKQAIYSFRNADLHAYLVAKSRATSEHTLLHNQRSVEGLIEACNALFEANPGAFMLPGISFHAAIKGDRKHPALEDRSEAGISNAALRIWRLPRTADGSHVLRKDAQQQAATATAAEISRLLREAAAGRILLGERNLRADDIAVLVRTHREGSWVKRALGALGIGSVELSKESIFTAQDAEELERVLLGILEPGRRGALFAALATELSGQSAGELDALRADETRLPQWIERFEDYRKSWRERGFGYLLRQWMDGEGVSRRLLARDDGERRLTNLLHLGELMHRASAEHPAPEALLRWLATQRAEAANLDELQQRLESDSYLVQIVTVHKAKGLEYGFAFCPFLWDGHRRTDSGGDGLEYHDENGDSVIDFRPEPEDEAEIDQRRKEERDAEGARLAYVALTRAVYRCYLIAGCYATPNRGGASTTGSTRSLLNWIAAGAGVDHATWRGQTIAPDLIEDAWEAIAGKAKPHISLADLPAAQGIPVGDRDVSADTLAASPAPKHIDPGWRIGSFTGLATGAEHEAAASDHDARALTVTASNPPDDLAPHDILRFPRGPSAGDCLHAMFERVDFTDPASRDGAIDRALELHPQRARDAAGGNAIALQQAMLRSLLDDVLAAPLPDGIVLGEVPANRRLNELGFNLPAAGLNPARLNGWLKAHQYPMPRLTFEALQGYLRGFIDLVFEHGGRYYLLDWKSNHLGYAREDYGTQQVAAAMQEHGYHLQYLLYSVALHRYLGQRIAGYGYDRHFGGVLYLFVRGVRPGWRDAKGEPLGTWFHRPSAATLASLDALLAGVPKAIAA